MVVESYLVEAHIFRIQKDKPEFLLLKRAESEIYPGLWQMVTGSINAGEKAYQTAIREIKEETGLSIKKFWIVPNVNSFYSPNRDSICMVPVFAALVDVNSLVVISEEHSEFKWVSSIEAEELLAWEGQRQSVRTIEEYFLNRQSNLKFVEITSNIKL